MRFKTQVRNVSTFTKFTSSLTAIGKIAWLRLTEDDVRFVIQAPEQGTHLWASITRETLFDDYIVTSANHNVINLELPIAVLHRALRSCASSHEAILRLTKRTKDQVPILCLTIATSSHGSIFNGGQTLVTQEIPVRVLSASNVENIREPEAPEADVHIFLPPLSQLRAITERFNRLSTSAAGTGSEPKLVLAANMSGDFKMSLEGCENVKVTSSWRSLGNPTLQGEIVDGNEVNHRSTMREKDSFAEVRIDGKEWAKVLKVAVLSRRVVAAFCQGVALVLYVFMTEEGESDETVLTYYISSYVAP